MALSLLARPSPRRSVLAGLGAVGALALGITRSPAQVPGLELRGSVDASLRGVAPGEDATRRLQSLLDETSASGEVLFLPPGDYQAGALRLGTRTRIAGIAGATRLVGRSLQLTAAGAERVTLDGLVLDGRARNSDGSGPPLVEIVDCPEVALVDCRFHDAAGNGVALTRVGGRVESCLFAGAALAGIHSRDAVGLRIAGNTAEDCGNGGILVHRERPGEDGSIISGNRIRRIRADGGGTGQNGNGINVFRAHGVLISGNRVETCAFSAIRSNSGSNVIIENNSCLDAGETAIYSEFRFDGASITGNLVDGAAIGISVANFNEGGRLAVCSNNLVRNLRSLGPYPADAPGFGMGISVEADTAVSGNVVEGAPLFGLKLGWGPYLRNVSATGNVLRDCGVGIAVSAVEGSGRALVANNIISGSRNGAIRGYRWSEAVTPDLLAEPERAPLHLTLSANAAG